MLSPWRLVLARLKKADFWKVSIDKLVRDASAFLRTNHST